MNDKLDQILRECLELLHQGVSLEECLAHYPENVQDLELLLRTALMAQSQLAQGMPLAVRTRVRTRVLAAWDRKHEPRQRRWTVPFLSPRWAALAATVVLLIALGGTGTVTAAGGAIPGDPLYPVKEIGEEARVWLARSPEAKVAVYSRLVKERADELKKLVATGQTDHNSIALARLEGHMAEVNHLVEETIGRLSDDPSQSGWRLREKLQEATMKQQSAEGVLRETLKQAPTEARPGLERALETIQQGRERVRTALETTLGRVK